MKPKLKVTQIRSTIGRPGKQAEILRGLGLRGPNKSAVVDNVSAQRGMIKKVIHLVRVEEVDG